MTTGTIPRGFTLAKLCGEMAVDTANEERAYLLQRAAEEIPALIMEARQAKEQQALLLEACNVALEMDDLFELRSTLRSAIKKAGAQ